MPPRYINTIPVNYDRLQRTIQNTIEDYETTGSEEQLYAALRATFSLLIGYRGAQYAEAFHRVLNQIRAKETVSGEIALELLDRYGIPGTDN